MIIKNILFSSTQHCFRRKMATQPGDFNNFVQSSKKIIGAALAYHPMDKPPKSPVLFLKPTTSYIQEGQTIILPKVFDKVVHEVELGVIIGKKCKNVKESEALDCVAGYCLALDMTAMCHLLNARKEGFPWTICKGFDTSTPVSKFIPKAQLQHDNLNLWLKVNGEQKQAGNTKDLVFGVPQLIAYITQSMTLEPYDLILTGTPAGSSAVKAGDLIECGMGDGLVEMKFRVESDS